MGFYSGFKGLNRSIQNIEPFIQGMYIWLYVLLNKVIYEGKDTGETIPLQAWADSKGFRRLRFPHFKTIGI